MKIGTKPYARSLRNELTEVTGRWTGRWQHSDQTPRSKGSAAAATRRRLQIDKTQDNRVRSSTERF